MNLIKLENVSKIYIFGKKNKIQAVHNVFLEIKKGDFIVIIGPSGSGKSTLMNLLGTLDVPDEGSIFLEGQNIADLNESELAKIRGKKIGFVFQQFNLIKTLTAKENIMLPMIFQRVPKEEREKKALEVLKKVGLSDRINHKPNELSGGEQQRVSIARALVNDPEIILADEPTGNLDSKTGKEIISLLKNLNKQGKTIILVTHDKEIAKQAKKKIKIIDGRIEKVYKK